jgi:hypothetical protein
MLSVMLFPAIGLGLLRSSGLATEARADPEPEPE